MKLCSLIIATCLFASSYNSHAQTLNNGVDPSAQIESAVNNGDYGTVTSVLILEDGDQVYEGYFNGSDTSTLHNTRSVTKTMTGMMVGAAVADGFLALDDTAARFFPELAPFSSPDPRKLTITIEDLLTMSSVLECDDWNQHSRGNEERMYIVEDWNRFFWDLPIRGFPSWATPPEKSAYGRSFSYCTAGVQILGKIVERASSQPISDYAEEKLLTPLGITEFEWPMTATGNVHLGGGLLLTAQGLAKFAELQRLNGTYDGHAVYTASWAEISTQPHAVIPDTPFEYGYLWWLMPYDVDGQSHMAAAMTGNGGNRVFVLPDHDLSVVFTNTDFNTPQMHQNAQKFFQTEIVSRLGSTRQP